MNYKFHFSYDKTNESISSAKVLIKKYKNYSPYRCNIFIVLGGDGYMLKTLKKFQKYKKPFYGMNTGSFGFLMNKYKNNNLSKVISHAKKIVINPLKMITTNNKNKKKSANAINDISLFRQSRETSSLEVKVMNKKIIKKLIGDGILVATPAGSTAYNLSVHGPILSLDSGKLAITPISPFRPRRWKGTIVSNNAKITIKNLNQKKRPVSVVADNYEVRNIKKIVISTDKRVKYNLLYDKNNSLIKKIKIEQLKKQFS